MGVFSQVGDINLFNVSSCVVRVRTSVSGKLPTFSVIKLPSTTIGRSHSHIHTTVGGYNFGFPVSHVAMGLTPTSEGGRNSVCSLPILLTVLGTDRRLGTRLYDSITVNRITLSNVMHTMGNILTVTVATGRGNVRGLFIPGRGTIRTTIVTKVGICNIRGVGRLVTRLAKRGLVRGRPVAIVGGRGILSIPSFSSIGNRLTTGGTVRVTTTKKRGVVLVNPPNTNGDVLTGELPKVVPSVSFSRTVRAAGVRSMTNVLGGARPFISRHPFHSPRRAISMTNITNNNAVPGPNRVSLTRGNILFLSRLPRFHHSIVRTLHRPVRSNGIAVSHITNALACPDGVVLITTVGPYPYNFFNRPAHRYGYSTGTIRGCLSGVSKPVLSHVSLRIRIPPISCDSLGNGIRRRASTMVGREMGGTEGLRTRECGNAKVGYGTHLAPSVVEGCYVLSSRTDGCLTLSFSQLNVSTHTRSQVLGITHAVTSLSNYRIVRGQRVFSTVDFQDLSQGC